MSQEAPKTLEELSQQFTVLGVEGVQLLQAFIKTVGRSLSELASEEDVLAVDVLNRRLPEIPTMTTGQRNYLLYGQRVQRLFMRESERGSSPYDPNSEAEDLITCLLEQGVRHDEIVRELREKKQRIPQFQQWSPTLAAEMFLDNLVGVDQGHVKIHPSPDRHRALRR